MQRIFAVAFFCLILCALAFPQDRGIIQCDPGSTSNVPAWVSPGGTNVIEQLSCGQMVSIVGLERGYVKIQIGERIAYVDAKYVGLPQTLEQRSSRSETPVGDVQRQSPQASQPAGASYDGFPRVDVFGGYGLLRPNLPGNLIPGDAAGSAVAKEAGEFALGNIIGWGADVTVNINRFFGVTANFGGFYKNFSAEYQDISADLHGSLHTFLFGPTFTYRTEKVSPYVRALFGLGRVSANGSVNVNNERYQSEYSENGFAAAVGGGIDFNVNDQLSVRAIAVDYFPYRHANGEVFTFNNIRWGSGLVFHF
jgi:opacity protein-like surface antigen